MSDEKKPGFFKRLFGFGKAADPEVAPPAVPPAAPVPAPEPVVETLPPVDDAAERIAREIAEARAAAEAADHEAQARAEAEQRALEEEAKAKAAREQAAKEEAEQLKAAQQKVAEEKAAQELAAKELAAKEVAAKERAEKERLAQEQRAAEERRKSEEQARLQAEAEAKAAEDQRMRAEAQARAKRLNREADEKAARDRAEAERAAQEKAAQEKAAQEKVAEENATLARAAQEKASQEKAAAEAARIAAEKRAADELAAKEQAARDEAARVEAERIAAEKAAALAASAAAAAAVPAIVSAPPVLAPKQSWWQKLKSGLSRTASSVSEGITGLFTKRKLDDETLEELEDLLIQADLGIDVAARISGAVGKGRYDKEIEPEEVKAILADEVSKVLMPVAKPLVVDAGKKPFVLLMVGVNGSGKTTTIGKLASKFRAEGKTVMMAAGDTFRAAAIEQLKVWGERTSTPVIARDQGGDAAGLAFDAIKAAKEQSVDVLLIDTAGRLQNRTELMAELEKVIRVIKKLDESAPHATLLVLDATVGQNALSQVDIFGKQAGVTGLVMTKLDGTARGGILVAIAEKFKLPIHFIGVGEGVDDLDPFEATDFARAIAGLERLA